MKFPRNTRILHTHLDAAPFASVFFLLVIFVVLGSLVYTPGVHVELPAAGALPGSNHPVISVAMDRRGQLYFENQFISRDELKFRLAEAARKSAQPLTLVVRADKSVPWRELNDLTLMARQAGINEALIAALPNAFDHPTASGQP